MLQKINLEHILFLDIETVPEQANYSDLDEDKKELWDHKSQYQRKDDFTAEEFYERAGIWAEFGKIICISVGYFNFNGDHRSFRVTTFHGDEPQLLKEFKNLLDGHAETFFTPFVVSHPVVNHCARYCMAPKYKKYVSNFSSCQKQQFFNASFIQNSILL